MTTSLVEHVVLNSIGLCVAALVILLVARLWRRDLSVPAFLWMVANRHGPAILRRIPRK